MKKSLIIVLVIGVIIFGGLAYLLLNQRTKNDVGRAAQDSSAANQKAANSKNFLVIKEWGVRMQLPDKLKNARYAYSEYDGGTFSLESVTIKDGATATIRGCKDEPLLVINRAKRDESILPSGYTVDEIIRDGGEARLTKIGEYYFHVVSGGATCYRTSDSKGQKAFRELQLHASNAYRTLESAN